MLFQRLISTFKELKERWVNWTGDREMEVSIRKRLTTAGFFGNSAKLMRVQLIALQRPGWLQVYRFEFSAKQMSQEEESDSTTCWVNGYGLVTEDARKNKSDVSLFHSQSEWAEATEEATKGLLVLRSRTR